MGDGKFKVGDRVRRARFDNGEFKVGETGVVLGSFYDTVNVQRDVDRSTDLHMAWCLELLPVAQQQAGPVRTITRREIVPGVYGRVRIYDVQPDRVLIGAPDGFTDGLYPDELREAARIFNELADVLEEQAGEAS